MKNAVPSIAHNLGVHSSGKIREIKNTGNASITKPKSFLTVSIHIPDLGRILLPNKVIKISGTPIPNASK